MIPICLLIPLTALSAVAGKAGLEAVSVSRDGTLVAAAGQNRTAYLLDGATLEVKKRIPLRSRIGGLAFTPDGKALLVEDELDTLRRIDIESGKELGRVADVSGLLVSPSGDVVAVRDLARPDKPSLRLLSADRLEDVGRCTLSEKAAAFAFTGDGKRLVVLESSHEGEEKRVPLADTPPALKGLARLAFQQQNDGRSAWLRTFDVPSGKEAARVRSWYTSDSDSSVIAPSEDGVWVVNRTNVAARIDAKGVISLSEVGERGPHAALFTADGKTLWQGGRAGGTSGPPGPKREAFALDELPGQAELVTRLTRRGEAVYGVTTAFRVFRVEKGVVKAAAVY